MIEIMKIPRSWQLRSLSGIAAAGLLLGACSSGDGRGAEQPTVPSTAETTTTEPGPLAINRIYKDVLLRCLLAEPHIMADGETAYELLIASNPDLSEADVNNYVLPEAKRLNQNPPEGTLTKPIPDLEDIRAGIDVVLYLEDCELKPNLSGTIPPSETTASATAVAG